MTTLAERRKTLEDRLAYLRRRLAGIETELDHEPTHDFEDYATEHEDDEVLERLGTSGQQEIRAIEAALKRMDAGEYGFCVRCGDEVEAERLDLLPFAPFCKTCAQAAQS